MDKESPVYSFAQTIYIYILVAIWYTNSCNIGFIFHTHGKGCSLQCALTICKEVFQNDYVERHTNIQA